MTSSSIHPAALIEDGARLGHGCVIHAHALIRRHCHLEDGVVVHPYAVLGGDPQDLGFKSETPSGVHIGARTVIREHVTVNRSTKTGESISGLGTSNPRTRAPGRGVGRLQAIDHL
jgi:UDP-N-acetylglucosamine acyltransferase